MRKILAGLLTTALCVGVFGNAEAEQLYRLVTKSVQFGTWGQTGIVSSTLQDTSQTVFSGANDVDTTGAINISDFAWEFVSPSGPASTVQNGLRIWVISDGAMDAVDSLYYAIETSPDGSHWVRQDGLIAAGSVAWKGVKVGQDQNGATNITSSNAVSFSVSVDCDDPDGSKATQVAGLGNWCQAPFVRIHILTDDDTNNVLNHCRVLVSYVAHSP